MPYGRVVGFKVGYTNRDIKERLKQYRTHNPYVKLIGTIDGTEEEEKEFHRKMENFDLFFQVGRTEWFEALDRTLIKGIENGGFNYLNTIFDTDIIEEREEE